MMLTYDDAVEAFQLFKRMMIEGLPELEESQEVKETVVKVLDKVDELFVRCRSGEAQK